MGGGGVFKAPRGAVPSSECVVEVLDDHDAAVTALAADDLKLVSASADLSIKAQPPPPFTTSSSSASADLSIKALYTLYFTQSNLISPLTSLSTFQIWDNESVDGGDPTFELLFTVIARCAIFTMHVEVCPKVYSALMC